MRYLIVFILALAAGCPVFCQVSGAEYFIDADPGYTKATSLPVTAGTNITANFTVALASQTNGVHILGTRSRDAQGRWSHTNLRSFYVLPAAATTIAATEYFIDTDPGYGKSTTASAVAIKNDSFAFVFPLSAYSNGFHTLGIRSRDNAGRWSHTYLDGFYVLPASADSVVSTEYFVDTDPGYGKATTATIALSADGSRQFLLPLSSYSHGFHTLGIRNRDNAGRWSHTYQYVFVIAGNNTTANIVKLQYYYSGNGATDSIYTYTVPSPAPSVSLSFTANLSELTANGDYDMHIIAISNDGSQSPEIVKHLRVCNGDPAKASFTYTNTGTQASFTNTSTAATTYAWNFGDGTTANLASPVHTYSNQGTYNVSLIATNTCNSDTAIQAVIISNNSVRVTAKAFLAGPYFTSASLMTDSLRTKGLIPVNEPYTGLGFTTVNSSAGKTVSTEVLNRTGSTAITDWIWIELRNSTNNLQVVASRPALIRRDGNIVDSDGVSPVFFANVTPGNYYVVVRHRNHLGVMSRNAISLTQTAVTVDFTQASFATYGTGAQQTINNVTAMWAGDANGNTKVSYNGSANDKNAVLGVVGLSTSNNVVVAYARADCNMDGRVSYNGSNNDKNKILGSVGLSTSNNVITEQLPK